MTIRVHTSWSKSKPKAKPGFTKGIGVFLIALGVFFLGVAIVKDARLAFLGERGAGEITKVTERISPDRSSRRTGESRSQYRARTKSGGKSTIYTVRYAPAGGASIEFDTLGTWRYQAKVGDRVKLVYFPEDPDGAEIDDVKQVWLPLATGLTVGTLSLVGGLMLVRLGRRQAAATAPAAA